MSRLAWITGASAGLGAEFARALAARGYALVLIARRLDRLHDLAAALPGAAVECVAADLTDDSALQRLADRLAAAPPDLLINNAGFGTRGDFAETAYATQEQMHRLHVLATLRLTHAALPGMIRRDAGALINVSSVAAFARSAGNVSYCATKAWMNAFTEGLHLELKARGSRVVVQALCPGFTYTEFHDVMGVDRQSIPRGLWLRAEDVVAASLRGLERGQWLVVPNWKYKLLAAVLPRLPLKVREIVQLRSPHRRR
jgi:short-subunit dehydrogenase